MTPRSEAESAGTPSTSRAATGRNLAALAARAWKVGVLGAELVPQQGPVLLVSNHTAFIDGLLLAAASPRPVHVLARSELFAPPFERLLRGTGQIPMDAEAPDRTALRRACGVLDAGGVVGVFPESHRGAGDVRHVRHWAAYLAARNGVVVVPVAILGSRPAGSAKDALPRVRSRIDVVIGEPVSAPVVGDVHRRAVIAGSGERLRQILADHVLDACARTGQHLPGPLPDPSHETRSDA